MNLEELEKKFGKGVLAPASAPGYEPIKHVTSTGSLSLDYATTIGGIPKDGKSTCIIGSESTGKSTLTLNIIREEQKNGGECVLLDTENSLDIEYASTVGVDLEKLIVVNPTALLKNLGVKDRKIASGEEWLQLTSDLITSNLFDIVILDSATSLVPLSELTTGIGGGQLGRVAAMFSQAYRNLNNALAVSKSGFVYTNQWRLSPGKIGDPRSEPLGEAMKFLQAMKISLTKKLDKDSSGKYGIIVTAEITKSKVGRPYGKAEYYIEFGKGIIEEYELLNFAVEFGLITRGGAWYTIESIEQKFQGEDNVIEFMIDNPEYTQSLKQEIKNKLDESKH